MGSSKETPDEKPESDSLLVEAGLPPVEAFVRTTLQQRLRAVRRLMKLARQEWRTNFEHVHQLRVATRRARTAARLLRDFLPPKKMAKINRWLSQVRSVAGAARDLDVLAIRFQQDRDIAPADRDQILKHIQRHRVDAQQPLSKACHQSCRRTAKQRCGQLLHAVGWRGHGSPPDLLQLARQTVNPLVADFFSEVHQGIDNVDAVHRVRIIGKRVRYALEVFSIAFPRRRYRTLLKSFKKLQESCGDLNDNAVALNLFRQWTTAKHRKSLMQILERLTDQEALTVELKFAKLKAAWNQQTWEELENEFLQLLTSSSDV